MTTFDPPFSYRFSLRTLIVVLLASGPLLALFWAIVEAAISNKTFLPFASLMIWFLLGACWAACRAHVVTRQVELAGRQAMTEALKRSKD